jgi:DNA-binding MarR family transcriptional regulator
MEGLNPTMLSRIAGKLEASGLVDRVADTGDGRVVHLAASPKGRELVDQVRGERADALRVALERLTDDERRRLAAALPVLEALAESLKDRRQ